MGRPECLDRSGEDPHSSVFFDLHLAATAVVKPDNHAVGGGVEPLDRDHFALKASPPPPDACPESTVCRAKPPRRRVEPIRLRPCGGRELVLEGVGGWDEFPRVSIVPRDALAVSEDPLVPMALREAHELDELQRVLGLPLRHLALTLLLGRTTPTGASLLILPQTPPSPFRLDVCPGFVGALEKDLSSRRDVVVKPTVRTPHAHSPRNACRRGTPRVPLLLLPVLRLLLLRRRLRRLLLQLLLPPLLPLLLLLALVGLLSPFLAFLILIRPPFEIRTRRCPQLHGRAFRGLQEEVRGSPSTR
mmetsp:Transcript_21745/g.43641  ORF Transcript_21745/g.43641 Transcript_21745/m.43641 type:complete len:303 (-) Transcript_21745:144-1052(-)